ncbi:MAG: OmpA family protein [Alphaproteobacteria bacterium]
MVSQPRKWLVGLLPVGLLAAATLFFKQGDIETDLAMRTAQAITRDTGTNDGKPWAEVKVLGRDVVVTGTAPTEDGPDLAAKVTAGLHGVRRVTENAQSIAAANPFGWSARREGNIVTLTGQVAADGARARLLEAAKAALPGLEIVDQMTVASGVPATATAAAIAGLAPLARVNPGSAAIIGSTLSFAGVAADAATREAATQALSALPPGVVRGALAVTVPSSDPVPTPPPALAIEAAPAATPATPAPAQIAAVPALPAITVPAVTVPAVTLPTVNPFTWSVSKDTAGLTLNGYVPSEAARAAIIAAAKTLTGGGPVIDRMQLALGLPDGIDFNAMASTALAQAAKLTSGSLTLTDRTLAVAGAVPDGATLDAIRAGLAGLLGLTVTGNATSAAVVAAAPASAPTPSAAPSAATPTAPTVQAPQANAPQAPVAANGAAPLTRSVTATLNATAAPARVTAVPPQPTAPAGSCEALIAEAMGEDRLLFNDSRTGLRAVHLPILDRVAAAIKRCGRFDHVVITGHADHRPHEDTNDWLSARRAQNVYHALIRRGVPPERMVAVGLAEARPLVPNDTEENMALNRRVDFTVRR